MFLKHITASAVIAALALYIPSSKSQIISDDRIRNMDISPTLGRGYSMMTNSFQSTCVNVEETTTPSYDYSCKCIL